MRLFLSSQNLGNYPEKLAELAGTNRKVAYIGNAKDHWEPDVKTAKEEEHKAELAAAGLDAEIIDLRNYFGKPAELEKTINAGRYGLVWCSGGNTFILRRAFAYSGFDKILPKLLMSDKLAYGGSSAGAIIATPGLYGADLGDDPHEIPKGYKDEIIWEGLNLVKNYIVPHYGSDWFGTEAEAMAAFLEMEKLSYKKLADGQVIVIDGDKEEFLG